MSLSLRLNQWMFELISDIKVELSNFGYKKDKMFFNYD